ncbi:MAG: Crp/Fnr family transcriptional regulator [Clostridium sp.]|nr:Crp/Fnr family transcriptional regulator [Clostridium sp.]
MDKNKIELNRKLLEKLYMIYPLLGKIDKENHGIISRKIVFRSLLIDEYLSTYGEGCKGFLFVISGKIKIQRLNEEGEETNLYDIGKGELCHEALSCYFEKKSLNVVGKAIENSEIGVVPFDVVDKFLLKDTEFFKYIYKDLHDKFNLIIDVKEELKHEPVKKRLIKLLMKSSSNIIYTTHSELAFELDSAREVVSRKLKELEKEGYINLSRGKVTIIKDLKEIIE